VIGIWLLNNLPLGVDPFSGQSLAGQLGTLFSLCSGRSA